MEGLAKKIEKTVKKHHDWRKRCLNMISAENTTSPAVRRLMSSDFLHRYVALDEPFYKGTRLMEEVEELGEELAKKLFRADFSNLKSLSGNTADMTALIALTKPGDTIASVHRKHGGYYGFTKGGCAEYLGLKLEHLPFSTEEMNIIVDEAEEEIRRIQPKLIFLGASYILFPQPVKELSQVAEEVDANIAYDGSHVLGLIAGKRFQDPLREGAEILVGSTHKTFPGPQGGLIVGKGEFKEGIEEACFPMFDNHHMHKVAALTMALAEMLEFGEEYANQIIRNAKALATALNKGGIKVKCVEKGCTETHQVLLDYSNPQKIEEITGRLEEANIIVDRGIRLGIQELTRFGMKERDMKRIAEFFTRVLVNGEKPERVAREVIEMCNEFKRLHYCFESSDVNDFYL